MTRPYEITVTDLPGGYGWNIEVAGEVIATSHGVIAIFPGEARQAAQSWVWLHKQLGYQVRKEWWDQSQHIEEPEPEEVDCGYYPRPFCRTLARIN